MTLMRTVVLFAALLVLPPAAAQRIGDDVLGDDTNTIGEWWNLDTRNALEAREDQLLHSVLDAGQAHLDELIGGPFEGCSASLGDAGRRACLMANNMRRYQDNIGAHQSCRIDGVLATVVDPDDSAADIDVRLEMATRSVDAPGAGLPLFDVENQPVGDAFRLFEVDAIPANCPGADPLILDEIRVPAASSFGTDKLILGYAYIISLINVEYNRPYVEATAARIAEANARWLNFEHNVIADQFPWETLVFNDWIAHGSTRFTGTLMYPPTRQVRVLHPVPVAVIDTGARDTLFRPRLTVEVIGLRRFDPADEYRANRGLSLIATLRADADESGGWGLLYTFKRGSIGFVSQKVRNENVVGIVFGIDLANQIDSKANNLMEGWAELRMRLENLDE